MKKYSRLKFELHLNYLMMRWHICVALAISAASGCDNVDFCCKKWLKVYERDSSCTVTKQFDQTTFDVFFEQSNQLRYDVDGMTQAHLRLFSSAASNFSASILNYWHVEPSDAQNEFNIFSTEDDMISGSYAWSCPSSNTNGVGFPALCSSDGVPKKYASTTKCSEQDSAGAFALYVCDYFSTESPSYLVTTSIPSMLPSRLPSAAPSPRHTSLRPSENPTPSPSLSPSVYPTSSPSNLPSISPTSSPSSSPISIPTSSPSNWPSISPTSSPSTSPSSNGLQSASPSVNPILRTNSPRSTGSPTSTVYLEYVVPPCQLEKLFFRSSSRHYCPQLLNQNVTLEIISSTTFSDVEISKGGETTYSKPCHNNENGASCQLANIDLLKAVSLVLLRNNSRVCKIEDVTKLPGPALDCNDIIFSSTCSSKNTPHVSLNVSKSQHEFENATIIISSDKETKISACASIGARVVCQSSLDSANKVQVETAKGLAVFYSNVHDPCLLRVNTPGTTDSVDTKEDKLLQTYLIMGISVGSLILLGCCITALYVALCGKSKQNKQDHSTFFDPLVVSVPPSL